MRAFEFLVEFSDQKDIFIPTDDDKNNVFSQLQAALADKISELPYSDDNLKNLKEIEDLLKHTSAQGRQSALIKNLGSIQGYLNDEAIQLLARYIVSIPSTPEEKEEFITLLKADQLIDQGTLLAVGKHTISEIVPAARNNKFIAELINPLIKISTYGIGKGEFFLTAFSPSIVKPKKGDLRFKKVNNIDVEVKTVDGGAGRFIDRQVKPSGDYSSLKKDFEKTFAKELSEYNSPATGVNIETIIDIGRRLQANPQRHELFMAKITAIVDSLFTTSDPYIDRRKQRIVSNIKDGLAIQARDSYVLAAWANYSKAKGFSGILMVDLKQQEPTFVFVRDATQLNSQDMWLINKTPIYFLANTTSDAFPQTMISYESKAVAGSVSYQRKHQAALAATNPEADTIADKQARVDQKEFDGPGWEKPKDNPVV